MAIDFDREAELEEEDAQSVSPARRRSMGSALVHGVGAPLGHVPGVEEGFVSGFPSTLDAIEGIAESLEAEHSVDVEERLKRFPELRGVEVATGNAARFPELMETVPDPVPEETEQEDSRSR